MPVHYVVPEGAQRGSHYRVYEAVSGAYRDPKTGQRFVYPSIHYFSLSNRPTTPEGYTDHYKIQENQLINQWLRAVQQVVPGSLLLGARAKVLFDALKAAETGGYEAYYRYLRSQPGQSVQSLATPQWYAKLMDLYTTTYAAPYRELEKKRYQSEIEKLKKASKTSSGTGSNPSGSGNNQPGNSGVTGPFVSYLLPWY